MQSMAHGGTGERLLARQEVGDREIHGGLRDDLAEFVVHEVNHHLFLVSRHARRIARARGCHRHEGHIQFPARLPHQFAGFGIPARPGTESIRLVAPHVEPEMGHGGDLRSEVPGCRRRETPGRSIDPEALERRPDFGPSGLLAAPLPIPASLRQRTVHGPRGPVERPLDHRRRRSESTVLRQPHAILRAGSIVRSRPQQRGRVLPHDDIRRGFGPLAVTRMQRLLVEVSLGGLPGLLGGSARCDQTGRHHYKSFHKICAFIFYQMRRYARPSLRKLRSYGSREP